MARLRIKEEAKAQGLTLEKLAERVGIDQGHFSRQARGTRPIKIEQLAAVARELKRPISALIEEDTGVTGAPPRAGLVKADVVGFVQAGNWREADTLDAVLEEIYIPPDPRLRSTPVAFKVLGDSYDEFVKEGGYVIGFLYGESVGELRRGMTVVAERVRAGGHLIERTLKMVRPTKKGFELAPRSSNKAHKPIRLPSHDDEVLTRVYAVVTTFVQPAEWS